MHFASPLRHARPRTLAATALLLALLLCGYPAVRAIVDQARKAAFSDPAPSGFDREDHFPGAAYFYAEDGATPANTGATALPLLARLLGRDASVHPAAPFSTAHASASDRGRAVQCLTAAVYYEAGGEPVAGQRAVAQVILNRVRHPAFPATVCGVVYQGSAEAHCQFSFACNGAMARGMPDQAAWARALGVAAAALDGFVSRDVGLATHYHTFAVTPDWNRSLVMTAVIGRHFFHRWQGYWGTPAAFHQPYLGGEPVPGPVRASLPVVPVAPPQPAVAPTVVVHRATAVTTPEPTPALPDASAVLDRWKDSGKPLQ
ncbi:cell wall hydrolase [Sphingomonas sp. TREG-RG-20F-R18-01]|uniref:cell wall hydrolase n=1 Tax=Sphingomonas sp. TREG-RG-20F-R18-01 TaxID=2914982 RepID=UPI001F56F396|nr:cell wall hydrolase [Sphingomonas sp. TREG-RG-20F-R18-01]